MIPKIIHYCWFGEGKIPELEEKYIGSWKKYCPDYEIKKWDENSIDIYSVEYMKQAYECKAWGFVPDVARLQIIYEEGGIYLDTDVELIKSLDDLLDNKCFMGFENSKTVNLGHGFGAEPHNPIIKKMLDEYDSMSFINENGTLNRTPSPFIQTQTLVNLGLVQGDKMQEIKNARIYTSEYFCPMSYESGKLNITDNTYSIHHYDGSWLTNDEHEWNRKRWKVMSCFGIHLGRIIWVVARFFRKLSNGEIIRFIKTLIKEK